MQVMAFFPELLTEIHTLFLDLQYDVIPWGRNAQKARGLYGPPRHNMVCLVKWIYMRLIIFCVYAVLKEHYDTLAFTSTHYTEAVVFVL